MATYLSAEWHALAFKLAQELLPGVANATARVAVKVTGGPDGDISYHQVVENGKVLQQGVGDVSDPDFTMLCTFEDSVKIQRGELDANVAFMQGRMKITGQMGPMMSLLNLAASPEYGELQTRLREATDY